MWTDIFVSWASNKPIDTKIWDLATPLVFYIMVLISSFILLTARYLLLAPRLTGGWILEEQLNLQSHTICKLKFVLWKFPFATREDLIRWASGWHFWGVVVAVAFFGPYEPETSYDPRDTHRVRTT